MDNKPWSLPVTFAFLCIISFFIVISGTVTGQGLKAFEKDRFISPDVCGTCHSSLYDMWRGTMHAYSFEDPLFQAMAKKHVSEDYLVLGEREKAENCLSCHNPIAFRSGQIRGSTDDFQKADDVTRRGISCDLCHSIDDVIEIANASFNATPGYGNQNPGIKLGPRKDSVSQYHQTAFSSLHTSSEFCGTCHNVTHPLYGTALESTYDEWKASPYYSAEPRKRTECQDCHMRQAPGRPATGMTRRLNFRGSSALAGRERPHIARHSITGANTLVPSILNFTETKLMAEEKLRYAATIEIIPERQVTSYFTSFRVRVRNEGAGHKLPTGVTGLRQMWLEVEGINQYGRTMLKSGGIMKDGSLEPGTRIFSTVFGDSRGNPTVNMAKAARILSDRRILPGGYVDEVFRIDGTIEGPFTIRAELKCRSMDPLLVKELIGEMVVPVVTMASRTIILNRR